MNLEQAKDLYEEATHVFIFTGAGMSVPLGTSPYWAGNGALYGGEETPYGLTALQHAKAQYWDQYENEQLNYFRDLYENFSTLSKKQDTHYHMLLKSLNTQEKEYFSVTSNIDNAFVNYGYNPERLYEVHGQTRFSQCLAFPKLHGVFPTTDPATGTAVCNTCGGAARPNTLFFNDFTFNDQLETLQHQKYLDWENVAVSEKSVILEIGAGTTITTIRNMGLRLQGYRHVPFIRINPTPYPTLSDERRERIIVRSPRTPFINLELKADEGIEALTS